MLERLARLAKLGEKGTDIAEADIFYHLRINPRLLKDLFEEGVDDEIEWSVFEATFAGFGKGRPYGERDDYIVGVLLGSVKCLARAMGSRAGKATYIAESPLLPGVRWLRIELSRSVAMFANERDQEDA